MPTFGSGKSCTSTRTGSPLGWYSLPLLARLPTTSFFFVSTLTTGWPASRCAFASWLMWWNWASLSSFWAPSTSLAGACSEKPMALSIWPTLEALTGCPWRVSSSAKVRTLLAVQRNGDIGLPRAVGSTRSSSATNKSGSVSSSGLRPAPGRRTRSVTSIPASSSLTASCTVERLIPVARATAAIPPRPCDRASTPAHRRRCRSLR